MAKENTHNEEMLWAALETACNTPRTGALCALCKKYLSGRPPLADWDGQGHGIVEVITSMKELAEQMCIEMPHREGSLMVALAVGLLTAGMPLYEVAALLKKRDISLTRAEFTALVAVNNEYGNKPIPDGQLAGNPLAVFMVAASRLTWTLRLHNPKALPLGDNDAVRGKIDGCWGQSSMESIERIIKTFAPAYVGEKFTAKVDALLKGLMNIGFYQAPASTTRLAYKGGLADHAVNMFCRMIDIYNPCTDAEVGKVILAVVCANLCRCMRYTATNGKKKVYAEDGDQTEPDGRKYKVVQFVKWEHKEKLPFADGEKAVYMALSYLDGGSMPDELVSAIAVSGIRLDENAYALKDNPLGACLTVANAMATFLDEQEGR
jgi:hypothetical protein